MMLRNAMTLLVVTFLGITIGSSAWGQSTAPPTADTATVNATATTRNGLPLRPRLSHGLSDPIANWAASINRDLHAAVASDLNAVAVRQVARDRVALHRVSSTNLEGMKRPMQSEAATQTVQIADATGDRIEQVDKLRTVVGTQVIVAKSDEKKLAGPF